MEPERNMEQRKFTRKFYLEAARLITECVVTFAQASRRWLEVLRVSGLKLD